MFEHGFKRTFLKFGQKFTEEQRYKLELEVPNSKISELIEFINHNNPTGYNYPVPDTVVLPVSEGNRNHFEWATRGEKINFEKIYKEEAHAKEQA